MSRYCIDLANYERFPTREVTVGDVPIGAMNPIRLQSMTNVPALDTKATVKQCISIFEAGADYARIAIPSIKEAENLEIIKTKLRKAGYQQPLIADVHFNPVIAETAARIVEKVRINPGNYIDKRATFKNKNYTDSEYENELIKIRESISPLVKICKNYGTAIRIGSNHGSLSDRIMCRYGNTAEGMVEAAMEYLEVFGELNFKNLVVSMKASSVLIMVKATRLLNGRMLENGWNFPQHLGVTEAGEGEDGRVRSALGIGSLLQDGIGDTIRVSLTEHPVNEIKFAKKLISPFENRRKKIQIIPNNELGYNPYLIEVKKECDFLPGDKITVVGNENVKNSSAIADIVFSDIDCQGNEHKLLPFKEWKHAEFSENCIPLIDGEEVLTEKVNQIIDTAIIKASMNEFVRLKKLITPKIKNVGFLLNSTTDFPVGEARTFYSYISKQIPGAPLILESKSLSADLEEQIIDICLFPGALLIDNIASGIFINANSEHAKTISEINSNMLQACGYRRTKAEFVSCPGCGRTNFDLETSVRRVKHKLAHLKNLKIAVMGCIVNGPGEMADADYGYVGAGRGMIHLYKGKTAVKKNISEGAALEELINLIKEHGDWQDAY